MILKHFTFLTLMASAILLDSAHAGGGKSGKSLKPEESIAAALDSEHQEGNFKPKFSISSEDGDGAVITGFADAHEGLWEIIERVNEGSVHRELRER